VQQPAMVSSMQVQSWLMRRTKEPNQGNVVAASAPCSAVDIALEAFGAFVQSAAT